MKRSALLILIFCLLVSLRNRAVPLIISSTASVSLPGTTYGTSTTSRNFTVSGTDMLAGILVTPPAGFEVSLDNASFAPTVTVGSAGTIPVTTIYVRLPGTANANTYSGNISLTSQGATAVNGPLVTGKTDPLKVDLAAYLNKSYGEEFPDGTYYYYQMDGTFNKDLKNGNKINSIYITFTGGNKALDKAGTYFNTVSIKDFTGRDGYLPGNYIFTYKTSNAYVVAADLYITAKNVIKPFGTQLNNVTGSTAFTAQGLQNGETITTVDIVYGAGAAIIDPPNVYTGSVEPRNARGGTIDPANYKIYYINGTLTIPPPEITPSSTNATNTIIACVGSASVSPLVQQFTFSAKNLTTDVTVAAPADFEIARSPGGPFSSRFGVATTGGSINNATVYVRSAATAPAGPIKGDVLLTSSGATIKAVAVNGTINALPTFTRPGVQNYINGDATTDIKMSGTGNYYTWTNDNPAIGLPASGTGDIASFKAVNNTSVPITATITVTPASIPVLKVINARDNTISTVDLINNKVINTFAVPANITSVVVSPDQTRLYVSNSTSGYFYAYNTADNSLITSIATDPATNKVIIHPNGKRAYLVNFALPYSYVDVINTETIPFTRVAKVRIGEAPQYGVISNDGTRLYVASTAPAQVTVINTVDNTVVKNIQTDVPPTPNFVAISPDDSKVYVLGDRLSVINTNNNTVATKLTDYPTQGLVVSPDGSKIYTSLNDAEVLTLNAATGLKMGSVQISKATPWAFSADGTQLFTTNIAPNLVDKGSVSVINTTNNMVINTVQVGALPSGLAMINSTGCPGVTEKFTITVNPSPKFSYQGAPSALDTEYGTISAASTFILKGTNVTAQMMTVKAPAGFSISVNGLPYSGEVLMPANGLANGLTISIRLNANADVGGFSGDISISAAGVNTLLVPMPLSTVRPAPITFTTEPVIKTYGDALTTPSTVTASLIPTLGSLKNGNIITSYTLKYSNGYRTTDNVTTYPNAVEITDIAGSNGFLAKNYKITTIKGNIRVDKAKLDIKANDVTKVYGTALTGGTTTEFTLTGIKNQQQIDRVTRTYIDGADALSGVKTYDKAIKPAAAGGNFTEANYEITYTNGNVIVTPATVTITAKDATRQKGRDNPVFTGTYQGFVNGQDEQVLTRKPLLSTPAVRTSPADTYPILVSDAAADNYTFIYVAGKLIITTPPELKIPNTFTPNGDGINDRWEIGNIAAYPKCTVSIFNRYGTPVFTAIGYSVAWDGTYKGQYVSAGTYYYVIKLENVEQPVSGSITLLR